MIGSFPGVRITKGPVDWQVVQRRLDGKADIPLSGTWLDPENRIGIVEIRIVDTNRQTAPAPHLDWHVAAFNPDRTWSHVLRDIPFGGPYRIETRLRTGNDDWRLSGDRIHFICIGDLWIIAGGENAVGFGQGAVDDPPEMGVHVFRADENWHLADHPLHDSTMARSLDFLCPGWSSHSPWLTFARTLHRDLGVPIGLIPIAGDGNSVDDWSARSSPKLRALMKTLRLASSLRERGKFDTGDGGPIFLPRPTAGNVAGILWHHGRGDATSLEKVENFPLSFLRMVESVRGELESPGLPFITCQLGFVSGVPRPEESSWWGSLRESQRAAGHDIDNLAVVPTMDLPLIDGIHPTAQSNAVLGVRAARAALGMVYCQNIAWRAPDFSHAFLENADRTVICLVIANLNGGLAKVEGENHAFSIHDEVGSAAIRKIETIYPNKVRIVANRELGDTVKLSHCVKHNSHVSIFDVERRPLLAFKNLPVHEVE